MVITNPFYWPRVFDKKVVISATSNQQRVVVSFPLNDVRFHLDGDCLRIILFFFFFFFNCSVSRSEWSLHFFRFEKKKKLD